jgi:hypothetical protein
MSALYNLRTLLHQLAAEDKFSQFANWHSSPISRIFLANFFVMGKDMALRCPYKRYFSRIDITW